MPLLGFVVGVIESNEALDDGAGDKGEADYGTLPSDS